MDVLSFDVEDSRASESRSAAVILEVTHLILDLMQVLLQNMLVYYFVSFLVVKQHFRLL